MLSLVVLLAEPWSSLLARLEVLGRTAGQGALSLAIVLAVILVGWLVATPLSRLVRGILRAVRFDAAMRRMLGPRATARHEPADVAGWAVYWVVMGSAALLAVETLGYNLSASVAERLGEVMPRIVAAAVIFAVGTLVAVLVGGVSRRFLASAEIRAAKFQGQVVTAVLTGFAALLALEQLGFAAQFIMAIGVVAVAAAGLGLALAFGLGCREMARDFVIEYLRSNEDDGPRRPK